MMKHGSDITRNVFLSVTHYTSNDYHRYYYYTPYCRCHIYLRATAASANDIYYDFSSIQYTL